MTSVWGQAQLWISRVIGRCDNCHRRRGGLTKTVVSEPSVSPEHQQMLCPLCRLGTPNMIRMLERGCQRGFDDAMGQDDSRTTSRHTRSTWANKEARIALDDFNLTTHPYAESYAERFRDGYMHEFTMVGVEKGRAMLRG